MAIGKTVMLSESFDKINDQGFIPIGNEPSVYDIEEMDLSNILQDNDRRGISYRRDMSDRKSKHRQYICKQAFGWDYYDNQHQYSKNKIHCSCPCCTAKTNTRKYKSRGMVDPNKRHSMKISGTSYKNWKHSDLVKIDSMKYQERFI